MNRDLYDLLALAGRYVFAALMLLIVLRAWKITIEDNRRARRLRQLAPQTGLSGELVVLDGGEKAPNGARYPVIREGIIGSSRRADIRIRHSSVRRVHAFFELREEGLYLRTHGGAEMSRSWEANERELLLGDGDTVEIGGVQLLLVLSGAQGGTRVEAPRPAAETEPDDPFALSEDRTARKAAKSPSAVPDDGGTLADDLFPEDTRAPARPRRQERLYSLREFPDDSAKRPARRAGGKKSRRRAGNTDEDLWL